MKTCVNENTDNTKCALGCEATGSLTRCGRERGKLEPLWRQFGVPYEGTRTRILVHSPAILLLGKGVLTPQKWRHFHTNMYINVYSSSITTAKIWNNPNVLNSECTDNFRHLCHWMLLCNKKGQAVTHATSDMSFKGMLVKEVSLRRFRVMLPL